jgi:DNA-binding response OmpR family regulator
MDVLISKLRKYLSQDENIAIINVRSKGFILQVKGTSPLAFLDNKG